MDLVFALVPQELSCKGFTGTLIRVFLFLNYCTLHRLWSQGVGGFMRPPLFGPRGGKGAHHFELQPVVSSGKVITLTQQCVTQVTKVMFNKQPAGPLILGLVSWPKFSCLACVYTGSKYRGGGSPSHTLPPPRAQCTLVLASLVLCAPTFKVALKPMHHQCAFMLSCNGYMLWLLRLQQPVQNPIYKQQYSCFVQ